MAFTGEEQNAIQRGWAAGEGTRLRMESPMSQGRYNVLFLSNRNTARSIFAEAVMNRV